LTGEPDIYVTRLDAVKTAKNAHETGMIGVALQWLDRRAVRGVLVPEGMVAVNPDDLAALLDSVALLLADTLLPEAATPYQNLRAAMAASNPATETPDAAD
jgi:hypothetical protein